MLPLALALLFASQIDTTDLLDLDIYRLADVSRVASELQIAQRYRRFLARKSGSTPVSRRGLEHAERAFEVLGYEDSRALYDLTGTRFLNCAGFQIMGYQSDVALEAIAQLAGPLPREVAGYGGMITFPMQWDLRDFLTGGGRVVTVLRDGFGRAWRSRAAPRSASGPSRRAWASLPRAAGAVFVAYLRRDARFADIRARAEAAFDGFDGEPIRVALKGFLRRGLVGPERARGRGLARALDTARRGDVVAHFDVAFQDALTDAQREDDHSAYAEVAPVKDGT